MKEFLLSDESLNSQDTIIMTDGIRLDRFLANPVMFYNHDPSKGVVGKWENVRKEDGKLYGTPVFDVQHDLGRMLQRQVDDGFVRGASIGIGSVEFDYNPEDSKSQKVIGCELVEVSVCDIPSNKNTLQFYYDGKAVDKATHRRLTLNMTALSHPDISKVMEALGLPEDATVDQMLAAIERLKGDGSTDSERLDNAIKCGYIDPEEKDSLLADFGGNIAGLSLFLKHRRQSFEKNVTTEYNNLFGRYYHAFNLTKLHALPQDEVKGMIRDNYATFTRFMECLRPMRKVMDDIRPSGPDDTMRLNWTLDDYRRKDPIALKRDPGLYERLLKQKKTT